MPDVTIRPVRREDFPIIHHWALEIGSEQYLSRIFPDAYKTGELDRHDRLAWFIIAADGRDAGEIWIEKTRPEDDIAVLGVLLAAPELLGKGIGRIAIRLAIESARAEMHFGTVRLRVRASNERAIRCYVACGFRKVSEFEKVRPTGKAETIHVMELALPS